MLESWVIQDADVDATRAAIAGLELGALDATADSSGSVSTRLGESAKMHVGNDFNLVRRLAQNGHST